MCAKQQNITLPPPPPDQHTIDISILGGIRIQAGDTVLSDSSNRSLKLWSVLFYFILNRERTITQIELIDHFWPEEECNNPLSALKMLILRIRNLISPLFDGAINPILSQRGAYQWNPRLICRVDVERFDALRQQAAQPETADEQKLALYREAISLYKGDLLPKQQDQPWVQFLSSWHHDQYINAVKDFAALLEKAGLYDEMNDILLRADKLHPVDEQLHILLIRSYLLQKKHIAALRHYEKTVELLYQTLGVRPSPELRALYREILAEEKDHETNLDVILDEMPTTPTRSGAFVCEYGLFVSIYHLEARRINRNGGCHHIALLTLSAPDGSVLKLKLLNTIMSQLQDVLVSTLRQSDVITRYSKAQFLILLPYASLEDSTMIMERIICAFHARCRKPASKLTYSLRGLEPV